MGRGRGTLTSLLAGAGVLAAFSACQLWQRVPARLPVVPDATIVGTARCLECHTEIGERYQGRPHSAIVARHDGCEHCHGGGSKHVESMSPDDILGPAVMRRLDAPARSALCLGCHERNVPHFPASEHAAAGVSCWDCHAEAFHQVPPPDERSRAALPPEAEGPTAPRDEPSITARHGAPVERLCARCHGDVSADFMLQFHHPVPEGRMTCTDCHALHGEARASTLDRENARCLACHEEMRGPFVFEHLAIEDGCVACHAPHGSIVEKLLRQDNNGLCEQCHFDARFPLIGTVDHTGFLSGGARCWDCHFQIHGSNTDENFVPLRIREMAAHGTKAR